MIKTLYTLAACLLTASALAQSPTALQADAISRVHPIASLTSDDFSDLQFLKPLLAGKRLVQLGESGHGVSEFNTAKVRLVKFLHEQMGYDVIAFESSLMQCYAADGMIGKDTAETVMRSCIFNVWHSKETLALFDYLDNVRKAGGKLTLTGFDMQYSGWTDGSVLLSRLLAIAKWPRTNEIAANEKRMPGFGFNNPISAAGVSELTAFYTEMGQVLQQQRPALLAAGVTALDVDMASQIARSLLVLIQQRAAGMDMQKGSALRDEAMANNIDFLLDQAYPGRKVIVWAHNAHINYERAGEKPMGSHIAARRKAQAYTIGLFMGHGAAGLNDHQRYEIPAPPPGSFEALLAGTGKPIGFVDFSKAPRTEATTWIFQPIVLRDWGTVPLTQTPAAAYDGVLYVDTVKPPDYR